MRKSGLKFATLTLPVTLTVVVDAGFVFERKLNVNVTVVVFPLVMAWVLEKV